MLNCKCTLRRWPPEPGQWFCLHGLFEGVLDMDMHDENRPNQSPGTRNVLHATYTSDADEADGFTFSRPSWQHSPSESVPFLISDIHSTLFAGPRPRDHSKPIPLCKRPKTPKCPEPRLVFHASHGWTHLYTTDVAPTGLSIDNTGSKCNRTAQVGTETPRKTEPVV